MFRMVLTLLLITMTVSACQPIAQDVDTRISESPDPTLPWTTTPTQPISTSTPGESDSISGGWVTPTDADTPEKKYQLCSPLAEHEIHDLPSIVSDPYAPPPSGKDDRHHGVDFAYYNQGDRESIDGEGVTAILSGRVAAVLDDRLPYGNMIIIETQRGGLWSDLIRHLELAPGESLYHLYAHFGQPPQVLIGQQIDCGELIGEVGKTGYNIVTPHLHLEIRVGPADSVFESMAFYDTRATEEEMNNYKLWRMSGVFRHLNPMVLFQMYRYEPDQE